MSFSERYMKFRTSWPFFIVLASLIAAWLAAHFLFHIDSDLGELNLVLSIEATLAVGMMGVDIAESSRARHRVDKYMLDLLEGIEALLKAQQSVLKASSRRE